MLIFAVSNARNNVPFGGNMDIKKRKQHFIDHLNEHLGLVLRLRHSAYGNDGHVIIGSARNRALAPTCLFGIGLNQELKHVDAWSFAIACDRFLHQLMQELFPEYKLQIRVVVDQAQNPHTRTSRRFPIVDDEGVINTIRESFAPPSKLLYGKVPLH